MNKITKLLSIFLLTGAIGTGIAGVAGCKKTEEHKHEDHLVYVNDGTTHHRECEEHPDYKVDEGTAHTYDQENGTKCVCGADKPATTNPDDEDKPSVKDDTVQINGSAIGTVGTDVQLTATVTGAAGVAQTVTWSVVSGTATVSESGLVSATAAGEVKIKATSTADTTKSAEFTITFAAASSGGQTGTEDVTTTFDNEAAVKTFGTAKTTTESKMGKFTFAIGTQFEAADVNTQGKDITIELSGTENSITFTAAGASSSADTAFTLLKGTANITPVSWEVAPNKVTKNYAVTGLEAGTYTLKTSKSARISNFKLTEKLAVSEPTGITVEDGQKTFLIGKELDTAGINVTLHYANGRQDPLTASDYTVSGNYKKDAAGTYRVVITSKKNDKFTAAYAVEVLNVDSLVLGDHSLDSSRNTLPVQTIFAKGGTFKKDNLAIQAVTSKATFYIAQSDVNISTVDTSSVGEKTVTVSGYNKSATYAVYVLDLSGVAKDSAKVTVNATATPAVNGNEITVKSVNQAMQVYKLLETDQNTTKLIEIEAGEYKEKIVIDLPNVKLVGKGTNASDTVLVYDALNGKMDPSGTTNYSTNGSASVTVTEKAVGFQAENLEIRNYYNTDELYTQSRTLPGLITADGGGTQAVAMLIDADMAVFNNVRFSGFHDTLYDRRGRHVYENCYIEGSTDYIFGEDAVSYYKNCTIKSLAKASDSSRGGYLACTKGKEGQLYGYVFDSCTITADDATTTAALARSWDTYMTAAFINCSIDAKFPTANADKALRYHSMNSNKPIQAALMFEYGNTLPDGTTPNMGSTELCTHLANDTAAAEFTTLAKIFAKVQKRTGATDFTTSYSDDWDGTPGVTLTTITYDLLGYTGGQLQGATGEYLGIKIDATNGKFAVRPANGDVQIKGGTILYIPMDDQYEITMFRNGSLVATSSYTVVYEQYEGSLHAKVTFAGTDSYYVATIVVDTAKVVTA